MTETANDRSANLTDEAQRWVARLASGEMDAAELDSLKLWRAADPAHSRAFEDQRALWRALGDGVAIPANYPQQTARPLARQRRASQNPRRARGSIRRVGAIAAAIALVFAFGPSLLLMLQADHRAGVMVENITLPDGTIAALDAGSAIAVHYDDGERRIELLRGNAWFEVAHGDPRPFRVTAQGGMTEDIGTAFEVRRQDDSTVVTVTDGAVRVSSLGGKVVTLRETERVRYNGNGEMAHLAGIAPDDAATWRRGEILVRDETPQQAVERIARYRHMPVYMLGDWPEDVRVSGVFRTDRPDEAIDAVSRMAKLDVQDLAGVILLRSAN